MSDETCCGACGYPIHATKESACDWCRQTADRIEELTAERDAWKGQYAAEALGLHVQMQRAEAAEAKLAKAMRIAKRVTSFEDTTEELAECGCDRCKAHLDLRATLAEIEGEKP
jgi:predicted DsbA family dithiol-disulfide isomerase